MSRKSRGEILVYGRAMAPALVDEPAEDEGWVHEQLLRWAEWCKPSKQPGRSSSAEGRYVAPKGNIYNPPEPRMMYSVLEARAVNEALLRIPDRNRLGLRARYHERLPDHMICRRFGLYGTIQYQAFMRESRLELDSVLRKQNVQA